MLDLSLTLAGGVWSLWRRRQRRWGGGSAPVAPTGLNAAAGNALVNLTWNASTGATGYYVKRSTTSGSETQIAAQSTTSYTDNSVANGTKYYYVVSAYNSYGSSANPLKSAPRQRRLRLLAHQLTWRPPPAMRW